MNIKRSFQKYFDKRAYIKSINKKRLKNQIALFEKDIILAEIKLEEDNIINSEISNDYNDIEVV